MRLLNLTGESLSKVVAWRMWFNWRRPRARASSYSLLFVVCWILILLTKCLLLTFLDAFFS